MSTALRLVMTKTVPSVGPSTIYRDIVFVDRFPQGGVQTLETDTAAGPDERPFREAGTGPAIRFYSERVGSEFTLAGGVTIQLSGFCSDAAFTGRFRIRLWKITHGGSDIETFIGQADATADLTTATVLHSFDVLTPISTVIAPSERLIMQVTVIPTGAGGTSFGTGFATHRYNLFTSGVTLTETVTFLPNGVTFHLRRTATTGIGTFLDLLEAKSTDPFVEAKVLSQAGGTEIQWTKQDQVGTIAVTEITAAAIASTANATTYASASFTPVANRLYLLAVIYSDAAPETTEATITTTTGLTFVALADHTSAAVSQPFNSLVTNFHRLKLFRAMKASGLSAGTYTVTLGDAATGCAAILAEVTGVATGGTDGSAAVRNVTMTGKDNTANPSMLNSLPAGPAPLEIYNGFYACFGSSLQTAPTPGTGYTALSDPDYLTPTSGLFAEWQAPNDLRFTGLYPACTLAASNWAEIFVELIAAQTSYAAVAWISPRVKKPFVFLSAEECIGKLIGWEADALANCGLRVKLFHRTPAGVETLVYTVSGTTELGTQNLFGSPPGVAVLPWLQTSGTLDQSMSFQEDDRVVLRPYIIPVGGTMAAGYPCAIMYDGDTEGDSLGNTDAQVTIYSAISFKAESDPAKTDHIVGGITMSGIGN
jgi:hypothetical protein